MGVGFGAGVVFGLVAGFVGGFVAGLVFGFVAGFVFGFVAGLVFGFVAGLVFGLVGSGSGFRVSTGWVLDFGTAAGWMESDWARDKGTSSKTCSSGSFWEQLENRVVNTNPRKTAAWATRENIKAFLLVLLISPKKKKYARTRAL